MSFQNNRIWTPNGSGSLAYGEMHYDTSTGIEQKRSYQWLMDTSEQELIFNKKQTIESAKATSGIGLANISLWGDGSSSQSGGQMGDCLFSSKPIPTSNNENVPSIAYADMNTEKKVLDGHFLNDSSINLSMSHTVEDSLCLNTGLQAIKASEARMSENCFAEILGNSLFPEEKDNKVTSTTFHRTAENTLPGRNYSTIDCSPMSKAIAQNDRNFISVGLSSSKRDDDLMLTNQFYDGISNNILSIGQSFNSGSYYINPMADNYGKENGTIMSTGPTFGKAQENLYAVDPFPNKVNEMFIASGSSHNKEEIDAKSLTSIRGQQDASVASLRNFYNKESSSILLMGQNCKKGEQTTICFGGSQDNPEVSDSCGRLMSNYDILLNRSSAQSSGMLGHKDVVQQLSTNKKNEQRTNKRVSSNNFPSNVKSLLSTGILDGVPVKYVSWSREKNLRGVIKGTGYLCGCEECKLTKIINAYEFERHANCKTKHPNNHIYFENGKTIYAVVQELKSTPQETLFDVMQSVTGTPVNQKNFDTWKASYQAATRELQRIYGRDELIVQS